jgi:hypothetical protein
LKILWKGDKLNVRVSKEKKKAKGKAEKIEKKMYERWNG